MKNNIWFFAACVLVFLAGYSMNDAAVSFPKYRVAVIDVPVLLSKSSEIQALKLTQEKDMEELNILISKAQNELLNEQDKTKLLQKEAGYRKEIESKRNDMEKEYNIKLEKINNNIKSIISKEAKKSNYNLVLPTGMVITGGDDITASVVKNIK